MPAQHFPDDLISSDYTANQAMHVGLTRLSLGLLMLIEICGMLQVQIRVPSLPHVCLT